MAERPPWIRTFLQMQRVRESIASVSLSHPSTCDCKVCRAAQGDEQALAEILAGEGSS